jgi:hypothetical protein
VSNYIKSDAIMDQYFEALGAVAHNWNNLHEHLGQLFATFSANDRLRHIALAVWYSTDSDRTQRAMLEEAVRATNITRWPYENSAADVLWLLAQVNKLADQRNNAVHAPVAFTTEDPFDVVPFSPGHRRAKNLRGRKLIVDFDNCSRRAAALIVFASRIENALVGRISWPDRPVPPSPGQKTQAPDPQPRPPRPKSRTRRRQSSRA